MTSILSVLFALVTLWPQTPAPNPAAARFDLIVRADFFAGFAGDADRLQKAMATCERALADNPVYAEALVWHGSGLVYQGGLAFQRGDAAAGAELFGRGLAEMNRAVALEPDNVGVLIPRGAVLLQATRHMPDARGRALLEQAVGDYEKTLAIQTPDFDRLSDHAKGQLLFGLAEGYSRLGNGEKARMYFTRLIASAPTSAEAPNAQAYLATGVVPASGGLGCVGCHK